MSYLIVYDAFACHDMATCGRYSLKYSYVVEEPPEPDDIVIRRVTEMLGIRRVTIYKRKTLNDLKIYIVHFSL